MKARTLTRKNGRRTFLGQNAMWFTKVAALLCLVSVGLLATGFSALKDEAKTSAEFVQKGDEAYRLGRYSAAVDLYRSAVTLDESNFTARLKLIELLARLAGREDEARKEMDSVLEMKELLPEQLRLVADLCSENGFPEKAKSAYATLLKTDPADLWALTRLVDVLLSEEGAGDLEEAKERIEGYATDSSSTAEGLQAVAAKCAEHNQYDLARTVYEEVLRRDEKNPGALSSVAECLVALGKLTEAVEKLSQASQWYQAEAELLVRLGEVFLRKGDYEQAEDAFRRSLEIESENIGAVDGRARVMVSTGRYGEARRTLEKALESHSDSPVLRVSLGRLLNYIGEYELARQEFDRALTAETGYPGAVLGLGMVYHDTGKLDSARAQFLRLYDFWDRHASDLGSVRIQDVVAVAIACALTDNPQDAIHVLETALKKDPTNPEALLWEGRLFSQRHQPSDAARELQRLLNINPNYPEAHVELAGMYLESSQFELAAEACRQALRTNPKLISALDILSSIQMLDFEYAKAEETVQTALAVNPRSLSTLAHLASCCWLQRRKDAYEEIRRKVFEINPVYSEFYLIVARACENKRRNEEALDLLKEAIALKPEDASAHTRMGILLMREGEEEEAEGYLGRSYRLDSYNPRTTNFINLLAHMRRDFATIRTEHFLMRWEKDRGAVLGFFLPQHLEEVYREVCGEFGYEPRNPTLVEIFESHDEFSARIVGLPFIATVGASLGKVVAADSPKTASFDWKDVLRHEFVHVVNLQQSRMQIPFWLTEGLATSHEESPLPGEWDGLVQRMLYLGQIIPLAELNSYFTRPKTPMHKQAAYAESYLICRYLYEKCGRDAIAKMIEMYGENFQTEDIISRCISMTGEEFQREIEDYILADARQKRIPPLFLPGDDALIQEKLKENPEDPLLRVAHARRLCEQAVNSRAKDIARLSEAEEVVRKVIEKDPAARGAYATLAEIHLARNEFEEAKDAAKSAIALAEGDFQAHRCLGIACERTGEISEAIAELEKAVALYPGAADLWLALRLLYEKEEDEDGAVRSLEGLVRAKPKDVAAVKTLARICLANNDYGRSVDLLETALRYTLYDGQVYDLLVDALEARGRWKTAREYAEIGAEAAYATAESLIPHHRETVLKLLKLALKLNPDNEKARTLLQTIQRQNSGEEDTNSHIELNAVPIHVEKALEPGGDF
jgi:tetratricopeptide (TPR) repeat protein